MSFVSTNLVRISSRLTRIIGTRWGDDFPIYFVTEYPKSGGTWLAQMLADYLLLPAPQHYHLPVAFASVIQNHFSWSPGLRNVCYLYRDGRDCCVSALFHTLNAFRQGDLDLRRYIRRRVPFIEAMVSAPDVSQHFPAFVEAWVTRPLYCRVSWSEHVLAWHEGHNANKHFVSYEDLRRDCAGALSRLVSGLTGQPADAPSIAATVEKLSFARRSGRRPGDEDRASHLRKGVVGDWVSYFDEEARQVFDRKCGDALLRLGYEPDRTWVHRESRAHPESAVHARPAHA